MQLSKQTLEVLKNFAGINQNIYFQEGSVVKTMNSKTPSVFATAEISETIPQEFGIYNLSEFLSILSIFDQPSLEFGEKNVVIRSGKNSVTYWYAVPEVLVYPTKDVKMPSTDVEFKITREQLLALQKTASILSASNVSFIGKGGTISVVVSDTKNSTSNSFAIDLGETDLEFNVVFKVENLKMIPGDYSVALSKKLISSFTENGGAYRVFIAMEKESTFA